MMGQRKRELTSEERKENKKCCADCKTTKTPLWRGGPAGPKSLCNACGIRYRKRKIPMVSLNKRSERKKERAQSRTASITSTSTSTATTAKAFTGGGGGGGERDLSESLKKSLLALGKDLMLQRFPSVKKQRCQRRRKLGEEEQAAVSLLALSCGLVFG